MKLGLPEESPDNDLMTYETLGFHPLGNRIYFDANPGSGAYVSALRGTNVAELLEVLNNLKNVNNTTIFRNNKIVKN